MPAPTITTTAFDPFVRPFAPAAPLPLIRKHARLAAIRFCERTRCWREIVTVVVDEQDEIIVAPSHAEIHEIEEATFDGNKPLQPTQFTDATLMERSDTSSGQVPRFITQTRPDTVALIPFAAGDLTLSVFLKPRAAADLSTNATPAAETVDALDVVPEFMFNQFAQAIADGALATLLMVPGQPFSNPNEALRRSMEFDRACDSHFSHGIQMQHRAPVRTTMYER